jgi:hypothetical protein
MFDIFDVIISVAAVILGLSLVVQAIQQIIKQSLDLKSSYMKSELLALFDEPKVVPKLLSNFQTVNRMANSAGDFAKRIVGEIENKIRGFGFNDLHLIEDITSEKLIEIVRSLPIVEETHLKDKVDDAIKQVELWFDVTKHAFQDHYARRMKYWAFVISAAVVIAMNANIIEIFKEFNSNKPMRDAMVAAMPALLAIAERETTAVKHLTDSQRVAIIKERVQDIQTLATDKSFHLVRWNTTPSDSMTFSSWNRHLLPAVARNWFGWLVMTLLVSLGSPFWYDLLNTVMGLKNSFKKDNNSKPS